MNIFIQMLIGMILLVSCSGGGKKSAIDLTDKNLLKDTVTNVLGDNDQIIRTFPDSLVRHIAAVIDKIKINVDSVTKDQSRETLDDCRDWRTLSKEDICEIIKSSEVISGSDWHALYEVLACNVYGHFCVDGVTYEIDINAGSFVWIYNSSGQAILGCADNRCKKYFLVEPGLPEFDTLNHHL